MKIKNRGMGKQERVDVTPIHSFSHGPIPRLVFKRVMGVLSRGSLRMLIGGAGRESGPRMGPFRF
jgi:hypothetical protein